MKSKLLIFFIFAPVVLRGHLYNFNNHSDAIIDIVVESTACELQRINLKQGEGHQWNSGPCCLKSIEWTWAVFNPKNPNGFDYYTRKVSSGDSEANYGVKLPTTGYFLGWTLCAGWNGTFSGTGSDIQLHEG